MAKVIERNVPIAEENVTLSGQPATNMFEDWSEEMTDKAENPYDEKSDVPHDKEERKKCLKEMDKIVKDDINGSLKFEITAKRLYAASQRVL